MILEIQHETRLEYTEPVNEWVAEVRMEPASDEDQTCQSFHLAISQQAAPARFQDGFGNRVHHFNLLAPHQAVRTLAASIVQTHPRRSDPHSTKATWPLDPDKLPLSTLDFVRFHGPVRATPKLQAVLEKMTPWQGQNLGQFVMRVSGFIKANFTYARDLTTAGSPIDDVLDQGGGVCQDFAHLMIAILRSHGVPARYVSGYIHRPNKESQSHAWCETWFPDLGWIGVDPTNDCVVNDHFIKVGVGRDYSDVPPNKGIYRGKGEEAIFVRVETRELERLPSLSWREQLPPLNVPMLALRPALQRRVPRSEETQEQQQQQ